MEKVKMIKCNGADPETCPEGKTICCMFCPSFNTCEDACIEEVSKDEVLKKCKFAEEIKTSEVSLDVLLPEVIGDLTKATIVMKKQEEKIKDFKEQILKAMEENGIKKFENDWIQIVYKSPTSKNTLDSKMLKSKYPKIADECTKSSPVKSSITITLKDSHE